MNLPLSKVWNTIFYLRCFKKHFTHKDELQPTKYNHTKSDTPAVLSVHAYIIANQDSDSEFWDVDIGGGCSSIVMLLGYLFRREQDWTDLREDIWHWSEEQLDIFFECIATGRSLGLLELYEKDEVFRVREKAVLPTECERVDMAAYMLSKEGKPGPFEHLGGNTHVYNSLIQLLAEGQPKLLSSLLLLKDYYTHLGAEHEWMQAINEAIDRTQESLKDESKSGPESFEP